MPVTAFPLLVEHTYWGLDRVLDALSRVDASALDADPPAAGMSSARHTIRHTYGFDRYWIPKFVTDMDEPPQLPDDLTEARAVWEPTRDRLRRYLEESDDSVLATRFEIRYGDDEVDTPRVIDVLSQFVAHHAQHRAELAVMATQLGQSPGELDFWDFIDEYEGAD